MSFEPITSLETNWGYLSHDGLYLEAPVDDHLSPVSWTLIVAPYEDLIVNCPYMPGTEASDPDYQPKIKRVYEDRFIGPRPVDQFEPLREFRQKRSGSDG